MQDALTQPGTTYTVFLTTFRRNGQGVGSPVGMAVADGKLYFMTPAATWKARRIANNPQVTLALCTFQGKVLSPAVEGVARRLSGEEARRARGLLRVGFIGWMWNIILPLAFGWMAKRPIPNAVTDTWLRPVLTQREIRRDLTKYVRAGKKGDMLAAAELLRSFGRPVLVMWAVEDRVMPPEHGRRLAEILPHGQLLEIPDSYTLIPEDQPGVLARAIRQFVRGTP